MIFKNLTFSEANDEFPRTKSQYRIAEKRQEFPAISNRRQRTIEERNEQSFPRKTSQDLDKQYRDYLQLNRGITPEDTTRRTCSEVVRSEPSETSKFRMDPKGPGRSADAYQSRGRDNEESAKLQSPNDGEASKFVKTLLYKLNSTLLDPDQSDANVVTNDILLIEIVRMITDFIRTTHRKPISYADLRSEESGEE